MPHSPHLHRHTSDPLHTPAHDHGHDHAHPAHGDTAAAPARLSGSRMPLGPQDLSRSVLAWPAWQRVLVVLPMLLLLWLAVVWASAEVQPW